MPHIITEQSESIEQRESVARPSAALRGIVLAIEASHGQGSVALAISETGATHLELLSPGLVHGRELLPRIDRLCERVGLEPGDLELIAVGVGPGSFTGVRIGVSAAKALAWGLRIPVLGISSLAAIAQGVVAAHVLADETEFAVVCDARRGSIYGARFRQRTATAERVTPDALWPIDTFLASLPRDLPLVGAGARGLPGVERFPRLEPPQLDQPTAVQILSLAIRAHEHIRAGREPAPPEYQNPHRLVPNYLRELEAVEKRGRATPPETGGC
ncbi:MAG: tRNA (adenosine(37)-N6)-threonylcarbamoyltransferase complex dimerization subunit type 1 TsaB [Planctomycetota bacterium]